MRFSISIAVGMVERASGANRLAACVAILFMAAAGASIWTLGELLPMRQWFDLWSLPESNIRALIFEQMALPRIVVALLVGGGLSFSAVLIQQCLRNPLADATTLGLASGSYLAIAVCAVFAPSLLDHGQPAVALGGAALVTCAILIIGKRTDFSPTAVLLTGLSINLMCGAAASALTVLNHEFLSGLFVWQSGNLAQNGWTTAQHFGWQLGILAALALLLVRPLRIMELGDAQARSVGVSASVLRAWTLAFAISIAALATGEVGVIGFVGLAAPNFARMLGARTFGARLFWAPLLGAGLLWLADQLVQHATLFRSVVSTGSAFSMLGAPIMLWLLGRTKLLTVGIGAIEQGFQPHRRGGSSLWGSALLLCVVVMIAAIFLGRTAGGWHWLTPAEFAAVAPWRVPRIAVAASSGALLALAGAILQRMTANPLASPEMLGISSGAAMGVIGLLLILPTFGHGEMIAAAASGSLMAVAAILLLNRRSGYAGGRLLLSGIALATLFSALASVILSAGDPRSAVLLAWMSGSTYRASPAVAITSVAVTACILAVTPLTARWLEIFPLGETAARSLGVSIALGRAALLAIIALSTGTATIAIGPLTFVGLIAPHIVRSMGIARPLPQVLTSSAMGALLLVLADWFGRNIAYPWQIPAGLISSIVGGAYFVFLLSRKRAP
ncbi:Fe(3+)-hydroxamate ABC transporter permease FhuB [Rhizobium sp. S152]|uniref:Fe(3+)-hydroxamate ABC transporter permease FhuB n=1 Tax=Rhizobium sp. S152 TaxID=3055038 RepID=UPI0025A9BFBA|nr:Fe(3+)-hydroxamate ABC transporter permease FhuB [Rhizobium sp. S152]MDM9624659.1 Fe(3+)-hydroxamate ABC transporter permease FhuB [Rhizobium sp. S152]